MFPRLHIARELWRGRCLQLSLCCCLDWLTQIMHMDSACHARDMLSASCVDRIGLQSTSDCNRPTSLGFAESASTHHLCDRYIFPLYHTQRRRFGLQSGTQKMASPSALAAMSRFSSLIVPKYPQMLRFGGWFLQYRQITHLVRLSSLPTHPSFAAS